MSYKQLVILNLISVSMLFMTSCQKDSLDSNEPGALRIEFQHVVGEQDLALDSAVYTNALGEEFSVSLFQYYVSNIRLTDDKGTEYIVPQDQSYFLIQHQYDHTHAIILPDVPSGDYTSMSFIIGVDSLRSTMDPSDRTGVLDVGNYTGAEKMYWAWNSGYIFVKIEGDSPQAPEGPDGKRRFRYHVGGFGGFSSPTINNIKIKDLSFDGKVAKVRRDHTPDIHIEVDLLKIFNGDTNISIAANPTVHFAPFSVNIANNYVHMFKVKDVH